METKKILLVDDEPDVVLFLQTALEDNGYTVATATSALDGLEEIHREKPSLVCLDVLMPEESGISLFQKLRTDPELENIPILIYSGLSLSRDLDKIDFLKLEDGTALREPEGFLEKPVDIDDFLSLVKSVLQ